MEESNPYATPEANVDEFSDPGMDPYGGGKLASRGSRLAAKIVSGVAVIVPIAVLVPVTEMGETAAGIGGVLMLLSFLGVLGLNIYWLADNGQTIGKRALGIKIVRSDRASEASLVRLLFIRGLSESIASSLCSLLWFIDVLFIFSDDRQCLHDLIADTTVIVDGTVGSDSYATDPSQIRSSTPSHGAGSERRGPASSTDSRFEQSDDEPSLYDRDSSGPAGSQPPEEAESPGGPEDDWSPPSGSSDPSPTDEGTSEEAGEIGGGTEDEALEIDETTDDDTLDAVEPDAGAADDESGFDGSSEPSPEQAADDLLDEDLSSALDEFEESTPSDDGSEESSGEEGSDAESGDSFDDADYEW